MSIDDQQIKEALKKVLKKGIPLEIEGYNRNFLAKECVKKINKKLVCEGYSVSLRDMIFVDVYYIRKSTKITTIEISTKGLEFEKELKPDWIGAISPVVRMMMETIIELTES
jgi:hypothetical protein